MKKTEIVLEPRQFGKTTKAIKKAAETHAYIACLSKERCRDVAKMAEEMGLTIRKPITFDELVLYIKKENRRGTRPTGFVENLIIDDLDIFLKMLFPNNKIDMVTMSSKAIVRTVVDI